MPNPGAGHVTDLASLQRQKLVTNKAIMQLSNEAPLFTALTALAKDKKVMDIKPSTLEDKEPVMTFDVYGNDSGAGTKTDMAATDTYIYIASASTRLKPYDLLKFDGYADDNSNTSKQAHGEVMMVLATPSTNTAQVKRNIEAVATSTYNITTSAAAKTVKCHKIGSALPEESTSRIPKIPALIEKYNYVEKFEEPFSRSDLVGYSKYFGPNELERRAEYAFTDFVRSIEASLLYGHRASLDIGGVQTPVSGGAQWHLNYADTDNGTAAWATTTDLVTSSAKTSRIWRPGDDFDDKLWEVFVSETFKKGSSTKFLLHGRDFPRMLKDQYKPQVLFEQKTTDFGMTVNSYTEQGWELQFKHAPMMDDHGPRDVIVLDMDYVELGVMEAIHRRKNIQANDSDARKDDWKAIMCLLMHFQTAHSGIFGMSDIT